MKAHLGVVVCLVFLGSGCEAVLGEVESSGVGVTVDAVSGDDGESANGTIVFDPPGGGDTHTYEVTCLKVAGNLALVGADQDPGNPFAGYAEVFVDDRPETGDDRVTGNIFTRGTSDCAEALRRLGDDARVSGGDIAVVDDFHPPPSK